MFALYILVVLVGCVIPFLMEDSIKERVIGYSFVLGDMLLLIILVYSGIAGIPGYEKNQTVAIGAAIIVLGMTINKGHRLINPKQQKNQSKKTRRQKQLQQNHKAAS